jgi:AbrB family looped-hinge helix DNA binding protein
MVVAKVTSKGQITIPKEIREKLGISPGEEIGFVERHGVFFIKKPMTKSPFEKWMGRLKGLEGSQSDQIIEDMRGKWSPQSTGIYYWIS